MEIGNEFNPRTIRLDESTKGYLGGFSCGVSAINTYIKEKALEDAINGQGVTFLVVDESISVLIAYYTLITSSIFIEGKNEVFPAIEIKMFAVNECYQNKIIDVCECEQPISAAILNSMIYDSYKTATEIVGFKYFVLHSLKGEAYEFYKKNEFVDAKDYIIPSDYSVSDCIPMWRCLFPD